LKSHDVEGKESLTKSNSKGQKPSGKNATLKRALGFGKNCKLRMQRGYEDTPEPDGVPSKKKRGKGAEKETKSTYWAET